MDMCALCTTVDYAAADDDHNDGDDVEDSDAVVLSLLGWSASK